jgi:hypothetical protein
VPEYRIAATILPDSCLSTSLESSRAGRVSIVYPAGMVKVMRHLSLCTACPTGGVMAIFSEPAV